MYFYRVGFFDEEANRLRYSVLFGSYEAKDEADCESFLLTCVKGTDRANWDEKYTIKSEEVPESDIGFDDDKYPIREDYYMYYRYLEALRDSGRTNMYGAGPYLKGAFDLKTMDEAHTILANWMHNYDELNNLLGWGR